jgi:hypothetical protein
MCPQIDCVLATVLAYIQVIIALCYDTVTLLSVRALNGVQLERTFRKYGYGYTSMLATTFKHFHRFSNLLFTVVLPFGTT